MSDNEGGRRSPLTAFMEVQPGHGTPVKDPCQGCGALGKNEFCPNCYIEWPEWKPPEAVTDGEVVIVAFKPYGHPDEDKVVRGIGWRDKAVGVWSIKDFEGFGVWVLRDDAVLGWEHLPEPPKEKVR